MMEHWSDAFIERFEPCDDAAAWMRTQPSAAEAWAICERGDWMLWVLDRLTDDRKKLVLCCCDVAEPALAYAPADETRPAEALRVARAWARGEGATIEEVRAAACAADAAAWAAAAAAWAAAAAAEAAEAAEAAAWAATWAAWAAARAAWAAAEAVEAAEAAEAAARAASLKASADIVRRHYPEPPVFN